MAYTAGRDRSAPAEEPERTEAPQSAGDTLAAFALSLQRSAGNRATRALLARETKTKTTTPKPDLGSLVAKKDIAGIIGQWSWSSATDEQRRAAIELIVNRPKKLTDEEKRSVKRLWEDMGSGLALQMWLFMKLWFKCVDKGVPLERWSFDDDFDLWLVTGPEVITEYQAKRVPDAVEKLSRKEYETLRLDLWMAHTITQKAFIVKALAAGRKMKDVDKFADAIRQRSDQWLRDRLNVVEEAPSSQTGPGIRQQWEMSCGPTTVQALHAQNDPIYALDLTGGGDVTQVGKNAQMKKEQGKILKGQGSVPTELGTAGSGAWVEKDFNRLKAETGITYPWTPVTAVDPANPADGAVAKALVKIKAWLNEGIYIPIVIGGSPNSTAHYNIILRYDPKSGYLIHDPGKGHSGWVTTSMIMTNTMSPPLAWSHLAGYDTPKKNEKKKK